MFKPKGIAIDCDSQDTVIVYRKRGEQRQPLFIPLPGTIFATAYARFRDDGTLIEFPIDFAAWELGSVLILEVSRFKIGGGHQVLPIPINFIWGAEVG